MRSYVVGFSANERVARLTLWYSGIPIAADNRLISAKRDNNLIAVYLKSSMHLRHLHLPNPVPYLRTSQIQAHFVSLHLSHKALPTTKNTTHAPPHPTLLTFQTTPTYTCGRREIGTLTPSQIDYLRCGGSAEFHEALRGGQTTFHGPGQLTAYLILSLNEHGLNPRNYVRLLEDCVIGTCSEYGIRSFTTENPGVWTSEDNKIASVGVHLRRNVTSHGVGINVKTDLGWFDRVVACGLVGKKTTSFENEGVKGVELEDVGKVFAGELVKRLDGIQDVEKTEEEEASQTDA